MFHVADNLFFGRLPDGSVRVLKFASDRRWDGAGDSYPHIDRQYADAVTDQVIGPDAWASVVASMSAMGEGEGRWALARNFHQFAGAGVDANGSPADEGGHTVL